MKRATAAVIVLVAAVACAPAPGAAQETVTSFDQLETRLKPGDRIWVTDVHGQKTHGEIRSLSADALTVNADGPKEFIAGDVKMIEEDKRDSLKNGTLVGLAVGGGLAAVWCANAALSDSADVNAGVECAEGLVSFGGLGTLLGLGFDALTPGKGPVVYRAAGASGAQARLWVAPFLTARNKGIVVSFAF